MVLLCINTYDDVFDSLVLDAHDPYGNVFGSRVFDTYDNVFCSLVFDVSAPERHDPVLAAGDERSVRGVGDLQHRLPVRHVLNPRGKVKGDLQQEDT